MIHELTSEKSSQQSQILVSNLKERFDFFFRRDASGTKFNFGIRSKLQSKSQQKEPEAKAETEPTPQKRKSY